jgi:hypothetical protein
MVEHLALPLGMEQLQLFATDDGDIVANITFFSLTQKCFNIEQ